MANTPWCGTDDDKLYFQSGQFTTTMKDSEYVGTIEDMPAGISWDGTNTPWCGYTDNKLYLQSGQFESALKTSRDVTVIDLNPHGISADGTNTPWAGVGDDKLYLQSGQFDSVIKTSRSVSGIDGAPAGISWDGTNTPWAGYATGILYLQSGQFDSVIKKSQDVSGWNSPQGVSWDGTNTPWSSPVSGKLYLLSGQFSSTLKDSLDVNSIDPKCDDICVDDFVSRTGAGATYERTIFDTITFSDSSLVNIIYARVSTDSITFSDSSPLEKILNLTSINTITFSDSLIKSKIYEEIATDIITFSDSIIVEIPVKYETAELPLIFKQIATPILVNLHYPQKECMEHWTRWIFISIIKYFKQIANQHNLHLFIEGDNRTTVEEQKYIELRMDGPFINELSKNYYRLNFEINVLYSVHMDNNNFYEPRIIAGMLQRAMGDICIYRYGNGICDDGTLLGRLSRDNIRTNDFGQIKSDIRIIQGTVEGSYTMDLTL